MQCRKEVEEACVLKPIIDSARLIDEQDPPMVPDWNKEQPGVDAL